MVKSHNSPISIYSAIAAVLVAAAFVFMCLTAPFAYAENTYTSSVIQSHWDSTVSHFGLGSATVNTGAFIVDIRGNLFETRFYSNPSVTVNSDGSVTVRGAQYLETYNTSNGNYTYDQSASRGFTVYPDSITIQTASSAERNFSFDDTANNYILGYGFPQQCYDSASGQSANRTIYQNRSSTGRYGFNASTPTLSSPSTITDYYDNYIKPSVNSGVTPVTTTTTTVTTTTVTTTVATLPTYPYQTNPPFELPSEWLGDYSETVPVPSVPPVTTVDVSGYDDILSDAENNFLSAIGFWFLAMKDFLSMNPTITYIAVFTIAIVLIILLLYNRGDDS